MTPGQRQALAEVRRIAAARPGAVVVESHDEKVSLWLDVSVDCRGFPRSPEGIDVRQRERFQIAVPTAFPFVHPSVWSRHTRWAGKPHVQWGNSLCLYQAPAVEWDASDGMFGFFDRLLDWLERGARGELDPLDGPVHPPVAYAHSGTPLIVPRADTPEIPPSGWLGFAELREVSQTRLDIVGWHDLESVPLDGRQIAPAIFIDTPLSFEYPARLGKLFDALEQRGVTRRLLYAYVHLGGAVQATPEPVYAVVGTPARTDVHGRVGQHLAVWQISAENVERLRTAIPKAEDSYDLRQLRVEYDASLRALFDLVDTQWCRLREAREQITRDRTGESPLSWFRGKSVALWGCGAIGSHLAQHLIRARVRRLVLYDDGVVAPGVLTRQAFIDRDIGDNKAEALARQLSAIFPDIVIEAPAERDLLTSATLSNNWAADVDVLIDATANASVAKRLEVLRCDHPTPDVIVASMIVGHEATNGLLTYTPPLCADGPVHVTRKAKLHACRAPELRKFADEFWPSEPRTAQFQPEPGCSEPTFTGSDVEVAQLASTMLLCLARELHATTNVPVAWFVGQPTLDDGGAGAAHRMMFPADLIVADGIQGYDVAISASAVAEIVAWTTRAERLAPGEETGGILFGERDDLLRIAWITDVLGPPPDSESSAAGFVCGVLGVAEATAHFERRSRGSSRPLGMWHTHPAMAPHPSPIDHGGMRQLTIDPDGPLKQLLVIVGGDATSRTTGAYLYDRDAPTSMVRQVHDPLPAPPTPDHRIGLALSGGGFRAVAFHLGAMRALHDRGVLDDVSVISAVSGGSILAALWAYGDEPFDTFDDRVTELLRRGLVGDLARSLLLTGRGPDAMWSTVRAGAGSGIAAVRSGFARVVNRARGRRRGVATEPLFRRSVSRTSVLEDVLAELLYGYRTIDVPARTVDVVINACELRSGTAFRFGSTESGSSRFGRLARNDLPVAHAVAASAAYPVFLPAFDETLEFVGWDGATSRERVILTDGGVYDNLGTTCLEPGRSSYHSTNVHPVDYIVSCDAGRGMLDIDTYPQWWAPRMKRSFEAVYRKVQDAEKGNLHDHRRAGLIRGFVMPFLGMQDQNLPLEPPDLVARDQVIGYPTDFSPMPKEMLGLLTARGEQLTRLLIEHHCPEIA